MSTNYRAAANPPCPVDGCGGETNKNGWSVLDAQRYRCKKCRKTFTEKLESGTPICPVEGCDGATIRKGKTAAGTQRYQCTLCDKRFTGTKVGRPRVYPSHMTKEEAHAEAQRNYYHGLTDEQKTEYNAKRKEGE